MYPPAHTPSPDWFPVLVPPWPLLTTGEHGEALGLFEENTLGFTLLQHEIVFGCLRRSGRSRNVDFHLFITVLRQLRVSVVHVM